MIQINEDTGNRRPIMLSLPDKEPPAVAAKKPEDSSKPLLLTGGAEAKPAAVEAVPATDKDSDTAKDQHHETVMETESTATMKTDDTASTVTAATSAAAAADPADLTADPALGTAGLQLATVKGLAYEQSASLIRTSVTLISIPVDPDTLHAVMRLLLRLLRRHEFAQIFAQAGGTRLLLELNQSCGFQGFFSLAALIVRHVMEDDVALQCMMEKVVRTATLGSGSNMCGVAPGSNGSKELHYVLRVLGPAACRNPEVFSKVTESILRIVVVPPKRDEDEAHILSPSSPQQVKCINKLAYSTAQTMSESSQEVIADLLNALVVKYNWKSDDVAVSETKAPQTLAEAIQDVVSEVARQDIQQQHPILRHVNLAAAANITQATTASGPAATAVGPAAVSAGPQQQTGVTDVTPAVQGAETVGAAATTDSTQELKPGPVDDNTKKHQARPLMPKSSVLRLLSELVKSYGNCAAVIANYTYHAGQSELVSEDCNALHFILDHLLPQNQEPCDKDAAALSRVLLASIAACNHTPDAQTMLVTQIKAALLRALTMPESTEKHARLQALASIMSTIIEACPVPGQMQNQVFKGQQQNVMNNIVKILLKKGLVSDLARIPHSLDLSSPSMATTINCALKPLETLSRIVNQPQTVAAQSRITKQRNSTGAAVVGTGGSGAATGGQSVGGSDALGVQSRAEDENAANQQQMDDLVQDGHVEAEDEGYTLDDMSHSLLDHDDGLEVGEPLSPSDHDLLAQDEHDLDTVLDTLLEREPGQQSEVDMLGDIISMSVDNPVVRGGDRHHGGSGGGGAGSGQTVEIDVEVTGEDDHHDSQMITQDISDDDDDDDDDAIAGQDRDAQHSDGEVEDERDDEEDDEEDEEEGAGEEPEDDDDADDDEDDDDDEGSDMDADDDDFLTMDNDDFYRLDADSDDRLGHWEEILPSAGGLLGDHASHVRSYQLPITLHDTDNGTDLAGPVIPPAPSSVTAAHPLLVRHAEAAHGFTGAAAAAARVHRTGRPRNTYRYNPNTQTLHVQYARTRHQNPPAILQRLLGANAAADVLQLSNSLVHGGAGTTRVHLVSEDELRVMTRGVGGAAEDAMFDDFFHNDTLTESDTNGSGVLGSIPTALCRWTEEAKVLDGDSMHDCVTVIKGPIIEELEKHRDAELAELREKRQKAADEAAAKKKKEDASKETTKDPKTSDVEMSVADAVQQAERATASTVAENCSRTAAELIEAIVAYQTSSAAASGTSTTATDVSAPAQQGAASIPMDLITPTSDASDHPIPLDLIQVTPTVSDPPSGLISEGHVSLGQLLSEPTTSSQDRLAEQGSVVSGTSAVAGTGVDSGRSVGASGVASVGDDAAADRSDTSLENISFVLSDSLTPIVEHNSSSSFNDSASILTSGESFYTATPLLPSSPGNISGSSEPQPLTTDMNVVTSSPSTVAPLTTGSTDSGGITATAGQQAVSSSSSSSSSSGSEAAAGSSTSSSGQGAIASARPANMFGDVELPEGVDPSFLAALPDNIRQEVIAEQLRLQRIQQRVQQQQQEAQSLGVTEVNPEFLAALPPNIQEEVLAQQRAEQSRLAVPQSSADPDAPTDPASFIQSLPSNLRQQVLADLDDTMVAVLPADLAAEASVLRRELEERHRRIMQERLFAQGAGLLSGILRHSGLSNRAPTNRYALRGTGGRSGPGSSHWNWTTSRTSAAAAAAAVAAATAANTVRLRGRHLLDYEGLTCLLVLLFVDEPKLNTGRLHRVLRNLCYHAQTRAWVISTLLSVLRRLSAPCGTTTPAICADNKSIKRKLHDDGAATDFDQQTDAETPSWLNIYLCAALGAQANVFHMHRSSATARRGHSATRLGGATTGTHISIHPQASPLICRHILDALISLAKSFPGQFLPQSGVQSRLEEHDENVVVNEDERSRGGMTPRGTPLSPIANIGQGLASNLAAVGSCAAGAGPGAIAKVEPGVAGGPTASASRSMSDFWELLVRLDNMVGGKKGAGSGKSLPRVSSGMQGIEGGQLATTYESSPLGQLMLMLAHPVVRNSQLLTDRLLRLLGLVSLGVTQEGDATAVGETAAEAAAATSDTTSAATTTSATTTTAIVGSSAAGTGEITADNAGAGAVADTATGFQATAFSTPLPGRPTERPSVPFSSVRPDTAGGNQGATLETQLQLAVEVLISKWCSEEGLEDATNLLLQLSKCSGPMRETVLKMLLSGARQLGLAVCQHIRALLKELQDLEQKDMVGLASTSEEGIDDNNGASLSLHKGLLADRFGGGTVVVNAPAKLKGHVGRELQLASMQQLTSKSSSQQFLLRVLKVVIQLREAARAAAKRTAAAAAAANRPQGTTVPTTSSQSASGLGAAAPATTQPLGESTSQASSEGGVSQAASNQSAAELAVGGASVSSPTSVETVGSPMDVDTSQAGGATAVVAGPSKEDTAMPVAPVEEPVALPRLSDEVCLDELWDALGECLTELARMSDNHAVLVLQPAVEAFFLVHAGEKDKKEERSAQQQQQQQQQRRGDDTTMSSNAVQHVITAPMSPAMPSDTSDRPALHHQDSMMSSVSMTGSVAVPPDTQKFVNFAETHRMVLNQILRQSTTPLSDGPFSVLVDYTKVLDFDVKRRYFRQELERMDERVRREDVAVHIRRDNVFEDSFRELHRRTADEWKHRFYIVFEGEEGQDAGGLLREWYIIISREIFNPMYALFCTSPGDRVTYTINQSSHCNSNHLSYFKFVGRIIAKAVYDNKLLECYFTRSFYKHILGVLVKYTDMESEDYAFYQGLVFLLENNIEDLGYDLTFSTEIQEFGVTEVRDLKPNGRNLKVTEETKKEYVKYVCQMKMTGAIQKQLNAFLDGFYSIIPKRLISIFNEQELELLISGLPTIDIDDLKANTDYHKYQTTSLQIQWFWRALRSFDQADRARFLQFVTGTSKVPLQGFSFLEGMNGTQKFQIHRDDRSTDRLPSAHTCFNQLDLPAYETYDKLRHMLLLAIHECSEGFGLA